MSGIPAPVIPGTQVYEVHYTLRHEHAPMRHASVIVGGAEGDPVQTEFADLTKIIAVKLWGDPNRADEVIPISITLNFHKSDLTTF